MKNRTTTTKCSMVGGGNHPIGTVQVRYSGGLGQGDGGYDGENGRTIFTYTNGINQRVLFTDYTYESRERTKPRFLLFLIHTVFKPSS